MCLECADRLVMDFLGRVKINAGIGDGPIKWIYIAVHVSISVYILAWRVDIVGY